MDNWQVILQLEPLRRDGYRLDQVGEAESRLQPHERYVCVHAPRSIVRVVDATLDADDCAAGVAVGGSSSDAAVIHRE